MWNISGITENTNKEWVTLKVISSENWGWKCTILCCEFWQVQMKTAMNQYVFVVLSEYVRLIQFFIVSTDHKCPSIFVCLFVFCCFQKVKEDFNNNLNCFCLSILCTECCIQSYLFQHRQELACFNDVKCQMYRVNGWTYRVQCFKHLSRPCPLCNTHVCILLTSPEDHFYVGGCISTGWHVFIIREEGCSLGGSHVCSASSHGREYHDRRCCTQQVYRLN